MPTKYLVVPPRLILPFSRSSETLRLLNQQPLSRSPFLDLARVTLTVLGTELRAASRLRRANAPPNARTYVCGLVESKVAFCSLEEDFPGVFLFPCPSVRAFSLREMFTPQLGDLHLLNTPLSARSPRFTKVPLSLVSSRTEIKELPSELTGETR